jgi:hypothetical protein
MATKNYLPYENYNDIKMASENRSVFYMIGLFEHRTQKV